MGLISPKNVALWLPKPQTPHSDVRAIAVKRQVCANLPGLWVAGTSIADLFIHESARHDRQAKDNRRLRIGDSRRMVMRADRDFSRAAED